MKKYNRYQDYVIKDGKLVGEFEKMYQDFDDPWEQSILEEWAPEKAIVLNFLKKINAKNTIELGCGLGHFSNKIHSVTENVLGIDISSTAITKAARMYPRCDFLVGDVLDFDLIRKYNPEVIIMSEISWYILDKLDEFKKNMASFFPDAYLIHLLTTYTGESQSYGKEKFTNLEQIMTYFNGQYIEWGEIGNSIAENSKRTYFIGKITG